MNLNVLLDSVAGRAVALVGQVAAPRRRPVVVLPLDIRSLLTQHSTRNTFEGIQQFGQRNLGRVLSPPPAQELVAARAPSESIGRPMDQIGGRTRQ